MAEEDAAAPDCAESETTVPVCATTQTIAAATAPRAVVRERLTSHLRWRSFYARFALKGCNRPAGRSRVRFSSSRMDRRTFLGVASAAGVFASEAVRLFAQDGTP